ncbi:preprotein translocase subunit SecA [Acinetobacter sp. NCu2D-2]|uniref:hypothetical protein n=1 Tax=Acinetobacter sp. NCu2D-2 TaxID=1608473 RepID=UPI0007CD9E64|nr:hypothetical protein [Acinetobacter sp. NCu2D-2]ANF81203.1 preprotein translocase subunit SecA [Acinetobacter sp. NCu2D-2]
MINSTESKSSATTSKFFEKGSWGWKIALVYDIFMMVLIIINLICLSANAILLSDFGHWLFEFIRLPEILEFYKTELRPWVIRTEGWFTTFLITELGIRWLIAIGMKQHQRWWFFPFVHWYEVLSILPQLRFLRLLRAVAIGYNLQTHGYQVIPKRWYRRAEFYYNLVMEELTSRIVLTVLDGVKRELSTSTTHKQLIQDLVEHHRQLFAVALADILQESLGKELQAQRFMIAKNVGQVVNQAIEDTPELTQLLRLIPIVGGRIEQQIQSIGQRLGENITQGLIDPFTHGQYAEDNATFNLISDKISQIKIENNPKIDTLVESAVFETIEAIRKQVKVKQWQQFLEEHEKNQDIKD